MHIFWTVCTTDTSTTDSILKITFYFQSPYWILDSFRSINALFKKNQIPVSAIILNLCRYNDLKKNINFMPIIMHIYFLNKYFWKNLKNTHKLHIYQNSLDSMAHILPIVRWKWIRFRQYVHHTPQYLIASPKLSFSYSRAHIEPIWILDSFGSINSPFQKVRISLKFVPKI